MRHVSKVRYTNASIFASETDCLHYAPPLENTYIIRILQGILCFYDSVYNNLLKVLTVVLISARLSDEKDFYISTNLSDL